MFKKIKTFIKKFIKFVLSFFVLFDYFKLTKKINKKRFKISFFDFYPCLRDKTIKTDFDRHYIYHTAWAARKILEINPKFHVDISSSLFFSAIASAIVPIKFYDYRPADLILSNLESLSCDLLSLPFENDSIESISCMHVIEHIGLGRYGENIDYDADLKAIDELKRVVAVNGSILFVVPIGNISKIQFNAHRIYNYKMILDYFCDFDLKEFSLIPEKKGGMVVNPNNNDLERENIACGCFWFVKKKKYDYN